jgi:hypothetical protein
MSIPPKVPRDLALAPVAAEVDLKLQRFRDISPEEIRAQLDLELDRPELRHTRDERAARVLHAALRNVNMHHWSAEITEDGARLRLTGGSVTLDLGLSATLLHYIDSDTTLS